ncbi:hypothetical protein ABPG75_009969 [Micractinium tetrahymenae]
MSVATQHSPFAVGGKRGLYKSEENEDRLQRLDNSAATKRYRARGSPSRCGGPDLGLAYSVGQATFAALRGLFPEMSDKVIANVLAEYGDNIDAAIKHLTDLRLSTASTSAAAAAATPQQQQAQQQAQQQQQAAAAEQRQQQQSGTAPNGQPKSAEQWVDVVVQEMAAATDMPDARGRAARLLQAFEQAVVEHAQHAAPQGAEVERLRRQLGESQRENHLLKRAVAVQNARMQQLSSREAEVAQLRGMVEGYQQKVQALELQNYSLSMHLKAATDGKDATAMPSFRNPDIF